MNLSNSSWKTSTAGIAAILTVLGSALADYAHGGFASINWPTTISALVAGVGLIFSRDNDKSSESVGAK